MDVNKDINGLSPDSPNKVQIAYLRDKYIKTN